MTTETHEGTARETGSASPPRVREWRAPGGIVVPVWAVAVFSVAFAARVAVVVGQLVFGLFDVSFDAADTRWYRGLAESLLEDGRYHIDGEPTAFVTPGYPLFLAVLFVFSRATEFIAIVQAVLGAATAVVLGAAAGHIAGRRAAWVAGLAAAVYPHLLFWTGYVLTETLYVFLVSLGFYLLVRASLTPDRRLLAAGAGAVLGAAALARPIILGFALLTGVVAVITPRWRRAGAVGVVAVVAVMAPWWIRNAVVFDRFIPTSTESGFVLWQGNSPGATGGSRGYVDHQDFNELEFPPGTSEPERDAIYFERATEWMVENPGEALSLWPNKAWNMWRPTYEGSSILNRLVTYATYPLLLAAGIAGLWVSRRHGAAGVLLIGLVGYHVFVHLVVTGMIRFRLPIEALLTVAAGIFVAHAVPRWRLRP